MSRYLLASWDIEAWAYEELRSLHDHLHETYGGGVSASRSKSSSSANQFSAGRKITGRRGGQISVDPTRGGPPPISRAMY